MRDPGNEVGFVQHNRSAYMMMWHYFSRWRHNPVFNVDDSRSNMSLRVWSALVTAQLGFGAYGVIVSKFAKGSKADPLVFCLLRDAGAFPVMLLTAFLVEGKVSIPSLR